MCQLDPWGLPGYPIWLVGCQHDLAQMCSTLNSKEISMAALKGSKTEDNLKAAFAGESQANRRYLYFANKADIEGQNDVAALFRSTAEL